MNDINIRYLHPKNFIYYFRRYGGPNRELKITVEDKQYDLLDAYYFTPLLLLRIHDIESGKSMTLLADFSGEFCNRSDIFMADGQIQIAEKLFIPLTCTDHAISTWTIARADGKAITL